MRRGRLVKAATDGNAGGKYWTRPKRQNPETVGWFYPDAYVMASEEISHSNFVKRTELAFGMEESHSEPGVLDGPVGADDWQREIMHGGDPGEICP